jgi:methylthioribose-1-phosphate isomerase
MTETAVEGEPTLERSVVLRDDGVHILDRRRFPFERRWVSCRTVEEVACAIEDMVTQSCGPYFATLWGLVLAARSAESPADVAQAAERLVATRPTNDGLVRASRAVLDAVDRATSEAGAGAAGRAPGDEPLVDVVAAAAEAADRDYRERSDALGRHAAALLPDDACVLTHCWADLYLVGLVRAAHRDGKRLRFYCTETRPYLQGARLTAETLVEMGVEATVIPDGAGAAALQDGGVDALVTGADRVTLDGHVVNKIGTLSLAVAARSFGVPFHALVHMPDRAAPTAADVPIEHRDGTEVLSALGHRTASWRAKGWYPAFDVTPPHFVATVVTDRGVFPPHRAGDYWRPAPAGTSPDRGPDRQGASPAGGDS